MRGEREREKGGGCGGSLVEDLIEVRHPIMTPYAISHNPNSGTPNPEPGTAGDGPISIIVVYRADISGGD
jgi:hypothetical protein